MLKYAKIIEDKKVSIFTGTDYDWARAQEFVQMDVEQGSDGNWYLANFVPPKPTFTYAEKRLLEYPPINEQLDMIYHDFDCWKAVIGEIKAKYPKP